MAGSDVELDELYREVVMDHHRHPRGREEIDRVDATAHGFNPVCGDDVVLNVAVEKDTVDAVQVRGRGCAICTASGSMLAELLPGRTVAEARSTAAAFRSVMHGAEAPPGIEMGDLPALEGVRHFAVRVKCAMLPWVTLEEALHARDVGRDAATASTETEDGR
jgi:nitrogen fixation protein NifU and related proteins